MPKLCECGCGQPTRVETRSNANRRQVRGEPRRFVAGHYSRTTKRVATVRSLASWLIQCVGPYCEDRKRGRSSFPKRKGGGRQPWCRECLELERRRTAWAVRNRRDPNNAQAA